MSEKVINCLRCQSEMLYTGKEKLQLGQTSWILGDLPNLIAGAMLLDIYYCPNCRKVELFASEDDFADDGESEAGLPQKTCPKCGREHDFDYPKCPVCGYRYM